MGPRSGGRRNENLKRYFAGLHAAFTELKLPIADIVAEGDRVAVLNRVTGKHTGDFAGLRAKGNEINAQAFQLYRLADGKLAEHWEVADFATLMRQIQS